MSDEPMAKPEDAETEAAPAAEAEAADSTEEAAASDPSAETVAALQAENAELKDRLLRAAAEMENMRRRNEREMADARQYAVTGFAREVLAIGDNLQRALESVPEEARSEGGVVKGLIDGVEMTERELLRVLDKHGVKRMEPHGAKFDPNVHQAMFEVEHDEAPHGTVVQVMQHGYSIGERVLRPALVGVAKAKPKSEDPPQEEPPKDEAAKGEAAPAEAQEAAPAESDPAPAEAETSETTGNRAANDG